MCAKKISRRRFIGQASCAAIGSTTLLNSLATLMGSTALAKSSLSNMDDYKALVCILLAGGNDSYNMLVPRGNEAYAEYATTRSTLALPQESLLPINPLNDDGRGYGIHPSMPHVQQLFEAGEAAFVANVGTLVEPIADTSDYYSGLKKRPLGLYSHSDQIEQWQTSVPQSRQAVGWGGRLADIMKSLNSNQDISMNISLSGRNVFQSGNTVLEYSIENDGNGVRGIEGMRSWYGDSGILTELRNAAVDSLVGDVYVNAFKKTFADVTRRSLDATELFANSIASVPAFTTQFSEHYLSQDLQMVAKTIAAQGSLGMNRQTFFTTFGGWDHHDEVLNNQQYMLGVLSRAIGDFFAALKELGMEDKVTLFTISDFARTLTSNGNGSDHAWGGNAIVAGGAVDGQKIYGQYPDMYLQDNPLSFSRGRFLPTTSADEYFAELALWFGVSPSDLAMVLPNIGNFYSPGSGSPLGFLPLS
ncbi:MAG: DUF1501 domain-containing protein [Saprospiraceae bacterium]|nr:DUF1501 domain-containing protein [Saprospiraceae bacterium]